MAKLTQSFILIFCFINIIAFSKAKQDFSNYVASTITQDQDKVRIAAQEPQSKNSTNSSSKHSSAGNRKVSTRLEPVFTIHVDEKSDSDGPKLEVTGRNQDDETFKNIEAFVLNISQGDDNIEAYTLEINQENENSTNFEPFVLHISQGSDNFEAFTLKIDQENENENQTNSEPFVLKISQGNDNIEAFILEINQEGDILENKEPFVLKISQGTENIEAFVLAINQESENLIGTDPFTLVINQGTENIEAPELDIPSEEFNYSTQEDGVNQENNEIDVLKAIENNEEAIIDNNEFIVSESNIIENSVPENISPDLVKYPTGILISNSEQYSKNEKLDQQSVETQEETDNSTPLKSEKVEEKGFLRKP